eukprot:2760404-Prymnesium_polylepis.1
MFTARVASEPGARRHKVRHSAEKFLGAFRTFRGAQTEPGAADALASMFCESPWTGGGSKRRTVHIAPPSQVLGSSRAGRRHV